MELTRYTEATPFEFGDLQLRELTPDVFDVASFAEVVVPIGVDREPRISEKDHRVYICFAGEVQFTVDEATFRMTPGDVLHIASGERYGFHNGGYEPVRLLLIRVPGPSIPENL